MRQTIKTTLTLMLALVLMLSFASCRKPTADDELWKDALYTKNTELGEGEKTIEVDVTAGEKTVTFKIHTDADTVGAALMEHKLLEGDQGDFGLYVKKVNGMLADYDVDQTYWAFYIGEDYAMTGVDLTEIDESADYRLVRTK